MVVVCSVHKTNSGSHTVFEAGAALMRGLVACGTSCSVSSIGYNELYFRVI